MSPEEHIEEGQRWQAVVDQLSQVMGFMRNGRLSPEEIRPLLPQAEEFIRLLTTAAESGYKTGKLVASADMQALIHDTKSLAKKIIDPQICSFDPTKNTLTLDGQDHELSYDKDPKGGHQEQMREAKKLGYILEDGTLSVGGYLNALENRQNKSGFVRNLLEKNLNQDLYEYFGAEGSDYDDSTFLGEANIERYALENTTIEFDDDPGKKYRLVLSVHGGQGKKTILKWDLREMKDL